MKSRRTRPRMTRARAIAHSLTVLADEALLQSRKGPAGHPGIVLLEAAAELGSAFAAWKLADCYEYGVRVRRNPKAATAWYLRAARLGCTPAITALGVEHWNRGRYGKAVEYYRRAAQLGEPFAQHNLALSLLSKGTRGATQEAIRWLRRAARAGHASAMFRLSLEYAGSSGSSTKRKDSALRWLRKAARAGSADATKILRSRGRT